jgi:hypothetical protein
MIAIAGTCNRSNNRTVTGPNTKCKGCGQSQSRERVRTLASTRTYDCCCWLEGRTAQSTTRRARSRAASRGSAGASVVMHV